MGGLSASHERKSEVEVCVHFANKPTSGALLLKERRDEFPWGCHMKQEELAQPRVEHV